MFSKSKNVSTLAFPSFRYPDLYEFKNPFSLKKKRKKMKKKKKKKNRERQKD